MPGILSLLVIGHLVGRQEDYGRVRIDAEGFAKRAAIVCRAVDAGHVDPVLVPVVVRDPQGLQLAAVRAPRREELDGPGLVTENDLVLVVVDAPVEALIAELVRLVPVPVIELVGEKFTGPEAMDVLEDRLPGQGNVHATLRLVVMEGKVGKFHYLCQVRRLVLKVLFAVCRQAENGRVRVDLEGLAERVSLLSGAVDIGYIDLTRVLKMEVLPDWRHSFAVGAPWGEELNHPWLVSFHPPAVSIENQIVKVAVIKLCRFIYILLFFRVSTLQNARQVVIDLDHPLLDLCGKVLVKRPHLSQSCATQNCT